MNVLLLGGQGMAGHMIANYWHRTTRHRLTVTVRQATDETELADVGGNAWTRGTAAERSFENSGGDGRLPRQGAGANPLPVGANVSTRVLDLQDLDAVERLVREVKPDVVVNAAGILNEDAHKRPLAAYQVNGLLPHWLAHLADQYGARLVHISSDCVFSGLRGHYREDEWPDGHTVYARTKALGEVRQSRHLTIRTSIIGPDARSRGIGLMRWFMSQNGTVAGYRNVIWNGVTTLELAKAIRWYAEEGTDIGGLVHLTSQTPVSKYELLVLMKQIFEHSDVEVAAQAEPRSDRTLAVTRADAPYRAPEIACMLQELRAWMDWP